MTERFSNSAIPIPRDDLERLLRGFVAMQETAGLAAQILIARLDRADGDTDLECNGDELDGTGGEDDFCDHHHLHYGPGCPVSDPDAAVDDDPCDALTEDGF